MVNGGKVGGDVRPGILGVRLRLRKTVAELPDLRTVVALAIVSIATLIKQVNVTQHVLFERQRLIYIRHVYYYESQVYKTKLSASQG